MGKIKIVKSDVSHGRTDDRALLFSLKQFMQPRQKRRTRGVRRVLGWMAVERSTPRQPAGVRIDINGGATTLYEFRMYADVLYIHV
jgi:hypothetical protein